MTIDPKEFVLGEDVTEHVKRTKTPGLVVSARLDRDDAKRLFALAEKTDRTPSQIAREALRRYITDAETSPVFQGKAMIGTVGVWLSDALPMQVTGPQGHWYTQKVVEVNLPPGVHIIGKPFLGQQKVFASQG